MENETKEFCPHGGMVEGECDSPATIAGGAGGSSQGRLRFAAIAAVALWALGVMHLALRGELDVVVGAIATLVGLASAAIIWLSRRASASRKQLAGFGSLYLLGTSLAIAMAEQHVGLGAGIAAGISWNAIWVALFPLMVPCSPNRTLLKASIAASATPVAYGAFVLMGRPMLAAADLLALFVPVYVGALLAWVGARFLARVGSRISQMASIGRYALVRRIGQGGMGEVWEAEHRLLARPVALKLISHDPDDGGASLARFQREARVTASLKSAHTIELYDFGAAADGRLFYAMELLEGMDLERLVTQHGPLPPERVANILAQALDSLEEAHARGLVHRDIKPANLHIGRYGMKQDHVKVLDFGLVKSSFGVDLGLTITRDNQISGTPAYMSPEAINGDAVDGRADVYALGAVAVFLLTGERVFPDAQSVLSQAVAHVSQAPARPSERGVTVPRALDALIMATLEKDPIRRPDATSLREMLSDLDVGSWTQDDADDWWSDNAPFPPLPRRSDAPPSPITRLARPRPRVFGHA